MTAENNLSGIQFGYRDLHPFHSISARDSGGNEIGSLDWVKSNKRAAKQAGMNPGEIAGVSVASSYQHRGIATHMFDMAKQRDPKIQHSSIRTKMGDTWASKVG